ncbi:general secretion pathway protein GspB [Methylomonas sp. SURF-1]|uniref:General secretion pathway protein GspB n=1 Tax=Methylomonas aurea TaxID=2952224 RepID=A0ABT1UEN6_9GAMM|nr:general secretion pathway protein GspB [Methylomonas sp. SURF-1]MCQ8180692.1 general secretion pathway protein GspB [Methylomonas sp. SURF-1]
MSYILNALRKSERERQASQPDTVASRIVLQHPPERQSAVKIIAALLAVNAAILAYFLGIAPRMAANDNRPPAASIQLPPQPLAESNRPEPADRLPLPAKPSPKAKPESARAAAPATAAVAKNGEVKKPALEAVKPAVAQTVPAKAPAAPNPDPVVAAKPLPEPSVPSPVVQAAPPIRETATEPAHAAAPLPPKPALQTLEDLPADVRQSLPALPINVYSYSPVPAERFVMIDMVKYVPGQMIKDRLELKQILEDGIVVDYGGHLFKIKRQ